MSGKPNRQFYKPKLAIKQSAIVYAQLRKEVESAGILNRNYFFYIEALLFVYGGFFVSLFLIIISRNVPQTIASSILFAFFATQIGGLFHDSGHRAIFKSAKNNDIVGYFSCALIAYTYRKWRINHNKHHANPNEEEMDPDIERPLLSFNKKQIRTKRGLTRFISKNQAFLYYPIGALTGIYSQLVNIRYFIKEPQKTNRWEKTVFAGGMILWFITPFFVFGVVKTLIIFLAFYPLFGLYLFNIFAPNHKGMPLIKKGQKISFLEQQIITSRNIKGGFWPDLLLMGLNYQTEHHLFPNCPRNNLKLITPYLKKACKKIGLEYTETNIFQSNKIILKELYTVSQFA